MGGGASWNRLPERGIGGYGSARSKRSCPSTTRRAFSCWSSTNGNCSCGAWSGIRRSNTAISEKSRNDRNHEAKETPDRRASPRGRRFFRLWPFWCSGDSAESKHAEARMKAFLELGWLYLWTGITKNAARLKFTCLKGENTVKLLATIITVYLLCE